MTSRARYLQRTRPPASRYPGRQARPVEVGERRERQGLRVVAEPPVHLRALLDDVDWDVAAERAGPERLLAWKSRHWLTRERNQFHARTRAHRGPPARARTPRAGTRRPCPRQLRHPQQHRARRRLPPRLPLPARGQPALHDAARRRPRRHPLARLSTPPPIRVAPLRATHFRARRPAHFRARRPARPNRTVAPAASPACRAPNPVTSAAELPASKPAQAPVVADAASVQSPCW